MRGRGVGGLLHTVILGIKRHKSSQVILFHLRCVCVWEGEGGLAC